jgi:hypothetical protein
MDGNLTNRLSCVVCGLETKRHNGWFLVMENRWLDRLKILTWHPLVARQSRLQSVCGEEHLRTLLTHWLAYANLQFLATGSSPWAAGGSVREAEADAAALPFGEVVGELAVQRESFSRVWTGSPEALECIVNALIDGMGTRTRVPAFPWPDQATAPPPEYALH